MEINPTRIPGRWSKGYSLDLHTTKSELVGHDGHGHPRFESKRSELGELVYKLKFRRNKRVIPEIAEVVGSFAEAYLPKVDLIIPAPPSTSRTEQPVILLARAIGERINVPVSEDIGAYANANAQSAMMKIFIGGSRRISKIRPEVHRRLDAILEQELPIVIGDANGADKAVQQYLAAKSYQHVEVFCSGTRCRNNVGNWPTRQVSVNSSRRDFDFYAAKDIQMARESSSGLMMWDGESAGTLMNVLRLIKQNKKVEIFEAPTGRFRELKSESEWNDLISGCSSEVRLRIQKLSAAEREVLNPVQASLL